MNKQRREDGTAPPIPPAKGDTPAMGAKPATPHETQKPRYRRGK